MGSDGNLVLEFSLEPERSGNVYVTMVTLSLSRVNEADPAGISDNSFLVFLGFYATEYQYASGEKAREVDSCAELRPATSREIIRLFAKVADLCHLALEGHISLHPTFCAIICDYNSECRLHVSYSKTSNLLN